MFIGRNVQKTLLRILTTTNSHSVRIYNSHWWKQSLKEDTFTNEIFMKEINANLFLRFTTSCANMKKILFFPFFHGENILK